MRVRIFSSAAPALTAAAFIFTPIFISFSHPPLIPKTPFPVISNIAFVFSHMLSFSSPFLYFCVSINFGKISHKIDFFFFVVVVVPFQGGAVKTSGLDV